MLFVTELNAIACVCVRAQLNRIYARIAVLIFRMRSHPIFFALSFCVQVMVAPAAVANASAQVDSFDLADSLAVERGSAFAGSSAASSGGSMNRRSSGSAATLDRAVAAVMTVSLAAAGCQLDAEGAVCVIPASVPAVVGASGSGNTGASTRNGLVSGTSLAKSGRARQPGLTATMASAPVQAQRRLSAAAQSSIAVSTASDSAKEAAETSSSKGVESPAPAELVLDAATRAQATRVFASRALLDSLTLVERAVQQNLYHDAHRRYRGGPAIDIVEGLLAAGELIIARVG